MVVLQEILYHIKKIVLPLTIQQYRLSNQGSFGKLLEPDQDQQLTNSIMIIVHFKMRLVGDLSELTNLQLQMIDDKFFNKNYYRRNKC